MLPQAVYLEESLAYSPLVLQTLIAIPRTFRLDMNGFPTFLNFNPPQNLVQGLHITTSSPTMDGQGQLHGDSSLNS